MGSVSLESIIDVQTLAHGIALHGGPCLARRIAALSPALRISVQIILPSIDSIFPRIVVFCGGLNRAADIDQSGVQQAAENDKFRAVDSFNLSDRIWTACPPLPKSRTGACAAWHNDQIHIMGGDVAAEGAELECTATVTTMEPMTGNGWETSSSMNTARTGAAAAIVGCDLYVCGGRGVGAEQILSSAERLSSAVGTWDSLPSMASARVFAEANEIQGKLYVCCGLGPCRPSGSHVHPRALERFNPRTSKWEALPRISVGRAGAAIASARDGLYVCGGFSGSNYFSSCEKFNISTSAWHSLPPMFHPRAEAGIAISGDRLIVCGGEDGARALCSVELLNLDAYGIWESLQPMASARILPVLVACFQGLFVFGGIGENDLLLASVECLAAGATGWEMIDHMPSTLDYRIGKTMWVIAIPSSACRRALPNQSRRRQNGSRGSGTKACRRRRL